MLATPIVTDVSFWGALRGLSLAHDLAMGRRAGHAQAVAGLSMALGRRLGLLEPEVEGLACMALVKDAG